MSKLNRYYELYFQYSEYKMQLEKLETDLDYSYERKISLINELNENIKTYRQLIKEQQAKQIKKD